MSLTRSLLAAVLCHLGEWIIPTTRFDALQEQVQADRSYLEACIAAGAEWRGPRCAKCGRPLVHVYTMRISPALIEFVCPGACPTARLEVARGRA